MTYIVFNSETEASAVARTIFEFGAAMAADAGYSVTPSGIHGRRQGVSDPTTAPTTGWATPLERLDGKWVVSHPKHHTAAQDAAKLTELMASLGDVVQEEETPAWFPPVEYE